MFQTVTYLRVVSPGTPSKNRSTHEMTVANTSRLFTEVWSVSLHAQSQIEYAGDIDSAPAAIGHVRGTVLGSWAAFLLFHVAAIRHADEWQNELLDGRVRAGNAG
jgi:hypothetical protein